MRAMARSDDGKATLVEMKAVDGAYPLYGQAVLDPPMPLADALAQRDGVFGAAADPVLLTRLGIKPGARLTVGNASVRNPRRAHQRTGQARRRHRLRAAPDGERGSPARHRIVAARQPGALALPACACRRSDARDAAAQAVTAQAREQFPEAGWDIRNRSNASPQLERNVERFTQFLTIVGLTALLVGGVGVGNAVKSHLDRRRDIIATMKALGASGRRVFAIYLTQVLLLALIGGAIGMVLGAMLPFLISWALRRDHSAADRAGACIPPTWRWRWSTG